MLFSATLTGEAVLTTRAGRLTGNSELTAALQRAGRSGRFHHVKRSPQAFVILSTRHAVAYDATGWMILERGAFSKTARKWSPRLTAIATKDALLQALQDLAAHAEPGARAELELLPERFSEWMAARQARERARAGLAA